MSLDEMRGRHVRDVVGEEMYSRIEPYIRRVLQGETVTFDVDQESNGVYSVSVRSSHIDRCFLQGCGVQATGCQRCGSRSPMRLAG